MDTTVSDGGNAGATVWFITGASSGIGKALAEQVLAAGDTVVATFRSAAQAAAFELTAPGRSHGAVADVRDDAQVRAAVQLAQQRAGGLDVVVNAAGYAVVGAVEELSDDDLLEQIDVNLFGSHRVIRAALPLLRERAATGLTCHVVNISSVAGQVGSAGLGAYDASKAALELLSEALRAEVTPLNIRVVIVEPGNIRTQWAGRSMRFAQTRLQAYDDTAGAARSFYQDLSGHQDGSPDVVAHVVRSAIVSQESPLRLVIGQDAHGWIRDKVTEELNDLAHWQPSTPPADS